MRDQVARTQDQCPTELAMEVVGGKWKLVVLEHLSAGTMRFGQLQRAIPPVTARMLTRQLRELETDQLVQRTVYAEVPPRVEYSLTDLGRSLGPVLTQLRTWGEAYRNKRPASSETAPGALNAQP